MVTSKSGAEQRLLHLNKKLERLQALVDRAKTEEEFYLKELKAYKITSLEEGQKKLAKLEKEIARLEAELQEELDQMEEALEEIQSAVEQEGTNYRAI